MIIKSFLENSSFKNKDIVINYIETLTNIEKKALEIAINNLESSFDIEKSIGYLEFIKKINDVN